MPGPLVSPIGFVGTGVELFASYCPDSFAIRPPPPANYLIASPAVSGQMVRIKRRETNIHCYNYFCLCRTGEFGAACGTGGTELGRVFEATVASSTALLWDDPLKGLPWQARARMSRAHDLPTTPHQY